MVTFPPDATSSHVAKIILSAPAAVVALVVYASVVVEDDLEK